MGTVGAEVARRPCIGCGGLVPDVDGPSHRYMLASPGCWAAYTQSLAGGRADPLPEPHGSLAVDAYAVQHPGVPGPQATQSVWVHLMTLHLVLERRWHPGQAVRLRRLGADTSAGLPWLEPPDSMGTWTVIDLVSTERELQLDLVRPWVEEAWAAWTEHHPAVTAQASLLVARLG